MVQQPTERRAATHRPDLAVDRFRRRQSGQAQRDVAEGLMGPDRSVMGHVPLDDVIQMPEIEAEEVVEALPLQRADPRLREGVGDGGLEGGCHDPGAHGLEQMIERLGELGVVVVDQEAAGQLFIRSLRFRH